MIDYNDTLGLISAVEQIKPPASYLVDTFFPTVETSEQTTLLMEYRKRGRERLAPYIVEGAKGVNIARTGSTFRTYSPPTLAPRRVLSQADIARRAFGETPVISTVTPAERAAKIQADDLVDLMGMIANRKNQQAAEILTTGQVEVNGYADDGRLQRIDTIKYDWDGEITVVKPWSDPTASIFDDLQAMSEKIQEDVGMIPSLMVVGRNVPKYLRQNKELLDWLMIPNRQNLAVASFEPRYITPQVQYIGTISALGLTIVSYTETYTGDDGVIKPFLDPDDVIIGVPGRGKVLHGAITMIDDSESSFQTYAAATVPRYAASKEANTLTLTLFSRFVLVPSWTSDWCHAKVGEQP